MTILLYTFSDKLFCNKPNQVDLSRRKGPKVCVVIDTMGVISLIALSILGGIGYLHVSTGAFWGIVGGSAALSLELVIYGIVLLTQKKKNEKDPFESVDENSTNNTNTTNQHLEIDIQEKEPTSTNNTETVKDPLDLIIEQSETLIENNCFEQEVVIIDNEKLKGENAHGIFVVANVEPLSTPVVEQIQKYIHVEPEKRCHIGCEAFFNFDIMCMRKSNYGIIFDLNPRNKKLIIIIQKLIITSNSRKDFIEKLTEKLTPIVENDKELKNNEKIINKYDQNECPLQRINKELERDNSWLSTDENFAHIKSLFEKNQIIAITQNIANNQQFLFLVTKLHNQGICIDSIYLSNLSNWVKDKFCDFLSALTAFASPLIINGTLPLKKNGELENNYGVIELSYGNKWNKNKRRDQINLFYDPLWLTCKAVPLTKNHAYLQIGKYQVYPLSGGQLNYSLNKLFIDEAQHKGQRCENDEICRYATKSRIINLNMDNKIPLIVNAFLLIHGDKKILIDVGCDSKHSKDCLKLPPEIDVGSITDVFISHTHFDHAGGLVNNDQPVFPKANLHLTHAQHEEIKKNKKYSSYEDRIKVYGDQEHGIEGISAQATPGHSDDHMVFVVEDQLVILGDVIHHLQIQSHNSNISTCFDKNHEQANKSRQKIFNQFSGNNYIFAGPHVTDFFQVLSDTK